MASGFYASAGDVVADAVLKDIERLLFEVWEHALAEAMRDEMIVDATGVPDWRFYMAVDLLDRWGPAFEEFERRFRAGPPR